MEGSSILNYVISLNKADPHLIPKLELEHQKSLILEVAIVQWEKRDMQTPNQEETMKSILDIHHLLDMISNRVKLNKSKRKELLHQLNKSKYLQLQLSKSRDSKHRIKRKFNKHLTWNQEIHKFPQINKSNRLKRSSLKKILNKKINK